MGKLVLDRNKLKERQRRAGVKIENNWERRLKEKFLDTLAIWRAHSNAQAKSPGQRRRVRSSEFTANKRFRVETSPDGLKKKIFYIPYKEK